MGAHKNIQRRGIVMAGPDQRSGQDRPRPKQDDAGRSDPGGAFAGEIEVDIERRFTTQDERTRG
jgi:hypothetical protein